MAAALAAAAAAATARPRPAGPETFVAYMKGGGGKEEADLTMRAILGEYLERGENHGRKVYQKVQDKVMTPGAKPFDVLLYYWDGRDGADFEGWWFGNKLGGTQVWAHCKSDAKTPPGNSWQIPWNGAVRPYFVVAPKEEKMAREVARRQQALEQEVAHAEQEADAIIDQANAVIRGDIEAASPEQLREAEALLTPQVVSLGDLERKVADAQRAAQPAAAIPTVEKALVGLRQLGSRVRAKKAALSAEYAKARGKRQQVEREQSQKALEEEEAAMLEVILPEATQKTNDAEDLTEKAVIAAEWASTCGEEEAELDDGTGESQAVVSQALVDAELAAKRAQVAISEAKIYVRAKSVATRNLQTSAKERADTELGALLQVLQTLKERLSPALSVRKDRSAKQAVKMLVSEVEQELVLAEVEVDRAEEALMMLKAGPSKETLARTQQALEAAEARASLAVQTMEAKKGEAGGPGAKEELEARLGSRVAAARERLQEMRAAVKDGADKVSADSFIKEAEDKLKAAKLAIDALEEANAEAEATSREAPPEDGSEKAAKEAAMRAFEHRISAAHSAASVAKVSVQMKLVEAKRLSKAVFADAEVALRELQSQVDASVKRIGELRAAADRRKRLANQRELEERVAHAEALVAQLKEEASIFTASGANPCGLPLDVTEGDVRQAALRATNRERTVAEAMNEVRKLLAAMQVEAKTAEAPAEALAPLAALQARLAAAQAETAEQRKCVGSVEQRLAARKVLLEAEVKLREVEEKVQKVVSAVDGLPEEPLDAAVESGDGSLAEATDEAAEAAHDAATKAAEALARDAQLALKTLGRIFETQSRGQGFAREALGALEPRVREAQARLDTSSQEVRDRTERSFARSTLREARAKTRDCTLRVREAAEAESSLSALREQDPGGGGEAPCADAAKVGKKMLELERAVQAALTAASAAKACVAMKRLAAKRLSEDCAVSATEALDTMQQLVEADVERLHAIRSRAAEAKVAWLRRGVVLA